MSNQDFDPNYDPIADFNRKSFSEALADKAMDDKGALITATLTAFKEGEPAAIKLVTQALLENQFVEETKFPITDAKFREIICVAADRIRGVPQNFRAD